VTVCGPPPHTLVDPVSVLDLAVVVRFLMREWREWIIITLCRNLFLWRNLRVAAKREATARAARELPGWSGLIRSALAWREEAVDEHIDKDATMPETLRFVGFVIETILGTEPGSTAA
jgi:hypothetical protein